MDTAEMEATTPVGPGPLRRSMRTALTEIHEGDIAMDYEINDFVMARRESFLNPSTPGNGSNTQDSSAAPSPDEQIIQLRGRRRLPVTWSPDIDASKRAGPHVKEKTPIKISMRDNPKSTIVLRSTPRKRLLLTDPKDVQCSPEKMKKIASPLKRNKQQHAFFSHYSNNTITVQNTSVQLQSTLKGLSQEQLIKIIDTLVKKHPNLEQEINDNLPTPDLKPLETNLNYLKKNIFKSLPTSRLTSKTDSPAYSRAATHVLAFKKCLLDQGRTLVESQHWQSLLEYVTVAWNYVNDTPLWDNPPHNAARKQCFKSLASMAMTALKKGTWTEDQLMDFSQRLKCCDVSNEDIQACLTYINTLRNK